MTKEVVKHRKDEKKKPTLTPKERKVKKQEKKAGKVLNLKQCCLRNQALVAKKFLVTACCISVNCAACQR